MNDNINGKTVMYGKYKGKLYTELPTSYVKWYGRLRETGKTSFNDKYLNQLFIKYNGRPINKKYDSDLFIDDV